jgi:hypothetical protein
VLPAAATAAAVWSVTPEFNTPIPELNTWVPLVVRAPGVAPEQVGEQEAAPPVRAVPAERAPVEAARLVRAVPAERAPVEAALGGRAPVGPGPQEQEPGSREAERAVRVVPVRSAAAVALVVSVSLGGLAVPMAAPEGRDWPGEAASPRGEEPPQGWVGSPVSVRLAAPRRGSASQLSAGSPSAPRKDWGPFPAQCWPVWAPAFPAVGRPPAVCRRAPAKAWVR